MSFLSKYYLRFYDILLWYALLLKICPGRSMDRTQSCEDCNRGSTPRRGNFFVFEKRSYNLYLLSLFFCYLNERTSSSTANKLGPENFCSVPFMIALIFWDFSSQSTVNRLEKCWCTSLIYKRTVCLYGRLINTLPWPLGKNSKIIPPSFISSSIVNFSSSFIILSLS